MLCKKLRHTRNPRTPRKFVEGSVPFPKGDDFGIFNLRQQIAETPNTA